MKLFNINQEVNLSTLNMSIILLVLLRFYSFQSFVRQFVYKVYNARYQTLLYLRKNQTSAKVLYSFKKLENELFCLRSYLMKRKSLITKIGVKKYRKYIPVSIFPKEIPITRTTIRSQVLLLRANAD